MADRGYEDKWMIISHNIESGDNKSLSDVL